MGFFKEKQLLFLIFFLQLINFISSFQKFFNFSTWEKRIYEYIPLLNIIIIFEQPFQGRSLMVLKGTSSLHPIILPVAFIHISVRPSKFPETIFLSILHLPFIKRLIWVEAFAIAVHFISIPIPLIFTYKIFLRCSK